MSEFTKEEHEKFNLEIALLEAIWLMRWNEDKTALTAVLSEEECQQMCKDIVTELDKAGFKIVRKETE